MKYGEKQMIWFMGFLFWDLGRLIAGENPSPREEEILSIMRRRVNFMEDCMNATEEKKETFIDLREEE